MALAAPSLRSGLKLRSVARGVASLSAARLSYPGGAPTQPLCLDIQRPASGGHVLLGGNGHGKTLVAQALLDDSLVLSGELKRPGRGARVSFESHLELLIDRLEKLKARDAMSWENTAGLVTSDISIEAVAGAVGWWQEKRRRRGGPLLRRFQEQTDFDDIDQTKVFRPHERERMTIRERTSSHDYKKINDGDAASPRAQEGMERTSSGGSTGGSSSRRRRELATANARAQRLANAPHQIRPWCCITAPFLELVPPGPRGPRRTQEQGSEIP